MLSIESALLTGGYISIFSNNTATGPLDQIKPKQPEQNKTNQQKKQQTKQNQIKERRTDHPIQIIKTKSTKPNGPNQSEPATSVQGHGRD